MKLHSLGFFLSRAVLAIGLICFVGEASAQSPYQTTADFTKYAMKLRESAILHMEPQVVIPTMSRTLSVSGKYPWKTQIVTTVFWVGEPAGGNNPVHNFSSSWDLNWEQSYGGFDNPNPASRRNYIPANFVPRQNPFYIALPYNDVTHGTTKPESKVVIPWFRDEFRQEGQSVCHDHWIAIRNSAGKTCYAQWSDCGPFRTDHWQYVFGNEKPRPNLNGGAGLDVSPAVRDYLQLSSTDVTDWKFVDALEVPNGPWALYGDNNTVAQNLRRGQTRMAMSAPTHSYSAPSEPAPQQTPPPTTAKPPQQQQEGPTIIIHQAQ
ncbi:hypothetical protein CfE428DRAFT_5926 [Chthoniobacter flavus Ellin428]|uniref:Uncharacterized protein n=1 Tax=Chthoniobacter flavus Ellin428 TaxID=497964 RepID=B4DAI5_9BACT|nr:hypothetical protein [Chthoniobacter flavus]EDY16503.1 hypothetical protein CfE428DRAFT_5926 [Chthoniobacter flavus Ellin428]TCO85237.1 hypothetical protein EV701_13237 [Chthoniobacter flavus]